MKILATLLLSSIGFLAKGQVDEMPYQGGVIAFYSQFSHQLKFTDKSKLGVAVLYWEVANGEIRNAQIINSLNEALDQEILRVLELTAGNWVSDDSTYEFRLPISFNSGGKDFYVDPAPNNYMEGIVLSTFGYSYSFPSDQKLIEKLNKNVEQEKYQEAEDYVNELIRRNPFNAQIRDIRIFCYNKLRKFDLACQDIEFLQNEMNTESKFSCIQP
ncbi:MAG: hypothetical protein ACFHWX_12770 [Bacteroidota bacterium]